jgi:tetratricopeptide (TPR) repeat protein
MEKRYPMKKSIIVLLLILFSSAFAQDELTAAFDSGVEAYQNKDFSKALELFLDIEKSGIQQADLFYNIGNCYFQLAEIGNSVLYYKRSLKLDPGHKQAAKNLAFVFTFTKDKVTEASDDLLLNLWNKLLIIFPLNTLAIILAVFFLLIIMIVNIMIIAYRNQEKTAPMFGLFILSFLFIFFTIVSFTQWNRYHNNDKAVLLAASEIGFSGPSEDFTRVFTIHEGMVLEIEKTEAEWSLIKLPNGVGGWIRTFSFERI